MKTNKLNFKSTLYCISIFILMLTSTNLIQAQPHYNFSTFTSSYSYLNNDTSVNNGLVWVVTNFTLPIGFNYQFLGNSVSVATSLGNTFGELDIIDTASYDDLRLVPMGSSIIDRALDMRNGPDEGDPGSISKISYVTEGTAGDRICKIQWQNAGFLEDYLDDDVSVDSVNFQIWLYEKDGAIEYRYGPGSITQPFLCFDGKLGPKVFLEVTFGGTFDGYLLTGSPSAPVIYSGVPVDTGMTAPIANGTVYRFSPVVPQSIHQTTVTNQLRVYPNPATDILHIADVPSDEIGSIEIYNALGQKVLNFYETTDLDISELIAGVYLLKLSTENELYSTQFSVK